MSLKLEIIIVGAGIAGLAAAVGLRRKGHNVTVVERHSGCQALGGAIGLGPSATRILIEYGMEGALAKKSFTKDDFKIFQLRYDNGSVLSEGKQASRTEIFGFPLWGFSRFRLQDALAQFARENGVRILFDSTVESIDQSIPALFINGGLRMEADLIIGADGVGSLLRTSVLGGTSIRARSPFSAYNTLLSRSAINGDPELRKLLNTSTNWVGPGSMVVFIDMPDDVDQVNLCLVRDEVAGTEGEWFQHGDMDTVKMKYKDWDPMIGKLLELTNPEDCYLWRLADIPPLPTWVSDSGRVVIAGDSAHAMLPYGGMGASNCIEDSACLSECIDRVKSLSDLPKVLKAFESIRRPRTEWMAEYSRMAAAVRNMPDGEKQRARDRAWASRPMSTPDMKVWNDMGKAHLDEPPSLDDMDRHPLLHAYTQGYNVFDHTNRMLDQILAADGEF